MSKNTVRCALPPFRHWQSFFSNRPIPKRKHPQTLAMSSDGDANGSNANLQMQLQLQNQRAQMQQQQLALHAFWQHQIQDISQIDPNAFDFKTHQLPLARIKKIMKTDEDVRMISAEAPVLFAKACEMFILELSLRAWIHTEENKRRTLQRNDIAMAITKTDVFDFLIDIVPRDDIKPAKKGPVDAQTVYQQQLQQQQAAMLQQLLQTQQSGGAAGNVTWPNQQLQQQMIQQYQRMQQNATAATGGASTPSNGALPNLSPSGSDVAGQTSANTTPGGTVNNSSTDQLSLNQRSVDV
ncbi:hypothetical protein PC129_g6727 [Phytophthora cactorum]|uniref:Core Histone H2A/H2B/H3 domain-containing protein n=1 Tax=Phytophthora cactorum TaxID=29920 RepID=A0A8T1IE18_9STRA|nr:hypothetical protein Pcac1_g1771 [Phytophthora cactorum]KAG2925984.1 hypothetical protein PC115_g8053 [Phytophthora cactorum]KAG2985635.1 hypothetical protein PC118_g8228 [Phytophthora cactorum]KAG3222571.1 hypothetical protein PC129_g6727 [Phytophthora cactorum]KAG4056903.1 hypothetical protein PC123_g8062 [Phytophthora cactorum]